MIIDGGMVAGEIEGESPFLLVMSSPTSSFVSRDPVAIPLRALPARLHPPEGSDVLTMKADGCRSQALSLLTLRVARCGEDAVTVEAWLPWGDATEDELDCSRCYLTMESVEVLAMGDGG